MDGNGAVVSSDQTSYNAAFPDAAAGMGCPRNSCTGYELTANLTFDENTNGSITETGDPTYWNGGAGWDPIGSEATKYGAVFEGNDHTISRLFINLERKGKGLFGAVAETGVVRNLVVSQCCIDG